MFIGNESLPKPVLSPNLLHLFNGNVLGLRQEEVDEESHDSDKKREEDEQAELHVAKHVEEQLSDQESHQHVYSDDDGLPG